MASRGLNPMTVTTMILLVLTTLIFAVLFITASNSITETLEESADDARRRDSLDRVTRELTTLRNQATQLEADIAVRKAELERLDVNLLRYGVAYVDGQVIAGADGRPLTFGGRTYTAKQSEWQMARQDVTHVNDRLEHTRAQLESRPRAVFASLEDQIDARSREQQAVLARANDMDTDYRADEERLLRQKDELDQRKLAAERQKRMDYSQRSSDINQKEDHIRTLLEIELRWLTELKPTGTVVETVPNDRTLVIDLGAKDRVFAGLLFDVFTYERGRYIAKGRIEVIDLQDRIATCRVLSETDGRRRPLAPGDLIGNPVFDPKRSPVFVLAGEFKQYNAEDLAAFIRATGGVISETLQPGCDFLIAGDRSERIQDIAREYQIIALTEEQLLQYVQPSFSVK